MRSLFQNNQQQFAYVYRRGGERGSRGRGKSREAQRDLGRVLSAECGLLGEEGQSEKREGATLYLFQYIALFVLVAVLLCFSEVNADVFERDVLHAKHDATPPAA